MTKTRIATIWLDGCSGCHMSFLDIDHRLIDLADKIELVYSPLVDAKEFPPDVDVTLVEGAVSSVHDLEKIKMVRQRTKILVSLGDCAVTSNVPSMRNPVGVKALTEAAYVNDTLLHPQVPTDGVPQLLPAVRPVHAVVKVDVFIPGCPPHADTIFCALVDLLEGRQPELSALTRFGA
jgi:NAD-reducing hydrogenase small subunit